MKKRNQHSKKTKKAARKAIRMLHDFTAFAMLQQRVRQKFASDMKDFPKGGHTAPNTRIEGGEHVIPVRQKVFNIDLDIDVSSLNENMAKMKSNLVDLKISILDRECKALKSRIEVLEQKVHHQKKMQSAFEFDLPKNEVPFVELIPNELQPGKMYIICEENSDNISVLRFRNLVSLPNEGHIQAVFENDKCASHSFSTYYHKFYQYTPTK